MASWHDALNAPPARQIEILNAYYATGGSLRGGKLVTPDATVLYAMQGLANAARRSDRTARQLLAQNSIYEKTLNPPSVWANRYVDPMIQATLLKAIRLECTGSIWAKPDPSGITEWLGSEAGGLHYTIETLLGPPRHINGQWLVLPAEIIGELLTILEQGALPKSWFAGLQQADLIKRLEVRFAASNYTGDERRVLLARSAAVAGRIAGELASQASGAVLPAFPTGELLPGGSFATAPTPPPPPKAWYRNAWVWVSAAAGALVGGSFVER